MSDSSLQIDLPPARRMEPAGFIPWIIAIACAAALLVLITELIDSIPQSLQEQALEVVQSSGVAGIEIATHGRDIHLGGVLNQGQSVDSLKDSLAQISGVRTVKDNINIVDPEAVNAQEIELFQLKLREIDALNVAFKPGSVAFTLESEPALQALYLVLHDHPEQRVRIEGHTDNTGPDATNLRLSQDRAAAIADYLSGRGIEPDRLIVKGYGSTQPIVSNDTEEGRSQNRRIEISHVY